MKDITHEDIKEIVQLDAFIQQNNPLFDYHVKHIHTAKEYALILCNKLQRDIDLNKMKFITLAHDLFKDSGLQKKMDGTIKWNEHDIPQDLNRYIRLNLDSLDEYGVGDFFNTDIQLHALASGLWLHNELGIDDPEILYPIFFHSCPIIEVYKTLDKKIQDMVDIMMLADKLSSNYLKINNYIVNFVRADLDKIVFGEEGNEFNYSLGLVVARLIAQGKNPDNQSIITTEFYYNRLREINPLLPEKNSGIKMLGGSKKWPKRESQILKMP